MKAILLTLGAVALWSTNAAVGRAALSSLNVEQVQVLQFLGATFVFAAAGGFRVVWSPRSAAAAALGLIGVTGTMVFQYLSFAAGPIAEVNVVAYAWPLIAAIVLILLGTVARPIRYILLTLVGFVGASLIVGPYSAGTSHGSHDGHLWAVASAVCMAAYTSLIGRFSIDQNFAHLVGSLAGLALAVIWCFTNGMTIPAPSSSVFWVALYLGIGPIGLGYLLWARGMRADVTGKLATLGYLTPVASTGLLLVAGEKMSNSVLLGSLVVIAACITLGLEQSDA